MQYHQISGLRKPVSRIVMGMAAPLFFHVPTPQNEAQVFDLLDDAFALGINTFDCAALYGEEALGAWMAARGNRDKCVVLTKAAHPNAWRSRVTPYDILSDFHDSLKKLRTDTVDLLLLHRDNPSVPVGDIMDTLARIRQEGLCTVYGVSNWTLDRFREANAYADEHGFARLGLVSQHYSLAEQVGDPWGSAWGDGISLTGASHREDRAYLAKERTPVLAYSPLGRGMVSGRFTAAEAENEAGIDALLDRCARAGFYCQANVDRLRRAEQLAKVKQTSVAAIALAWILNDPMETDVIISFSRRQRIEEAIAALDLSLTPQERYWLETGAEPL